MGEAGEKSWKLEGCVERLEREAGGGRQRKIESACAKGKGSSRRRVKGGGRQSEHALRIDGKYETSVRTWYKFIFYCQHSHTHTHIEEALEKILKIF